MPVAKEDTHAFDLDYPLLAFSNDPRDHWTLRDAVQGVQVFGGIGSGKSSGSGKALSLAFLKNQYGGLVLTAKPDETERWLELADRIGRIKDIVVFGDWRSVKRYQAKYNNLITGSYAFNPLLYESNRQSEGGGQTRNLAGMISSLSKMAGRIGGAGGGGSKDSFWEMAMVRAVIPAIDLLKLAIKATDQDPNDAKALFVLSVANIARIIREASQRDKEGNFPEGNYVVEVLSHAAIYIEDQQELITPEMADEDHLDIEREVRAYNNAEAYFTKDFQEMGNDLRTSVTETFYAFSHSFVAGMLADFFAQHTSHEVKPERTFEGKIIILDFPVKKYQQNGIVAQTFYKTIWQQAVERRQVDKTTRPVFLWIDESQYFVNEQDMMFQTTARSSKACTVFLTQNINNYYAVMGGNRYKERVDSLMGNLITKIFHNNTDAVTNEWAAKTISRTFQSKMGVNVSDQGQNTSVSRALNYQVEPHAFTILKKGGGADKKVEAIITGRQWSNGKNYLTTTFDQDADKKLKL